MSGRTHKGVAEFTDEWWPQTREDVGTNHVILEKRPRGRGKG